MTPYPAASAGPSRTAATPTYEVGVDIGRTFTDEVCRSSDGELRLMKIPTTRADPSAGVLRAVDHMASAWGISPQPYSA